VALTPARPDFWLRILLPNWGVAVFSDHVFPEDRELVQRRLEEAFQNGHLEFECRIIRADQAMRWISAKGEAVRNEQGQPIRMMGVITDVTERKRPKRCSGTAKSGTAKLFENNPHPTWVFDRETLRFLAVNAAAVGKYGYSRDEFLAMTVKDIRSPEDVPALSKLWELSETEMRATVRGGIDKGRTVIDVENTSYALTFFGRPARVVVAVDVTQKKRAEEEKRKFMTTWLLPIKSSSFATARWSASQN